MMLDFSSETQFQDGSFIRCARSSPYSSGSSPQLELDALSRISLSSSRFVDSSSLSATVLSTRKQVEISTYRWISNIILSRSPSGYLSEISEVLLDRTRFRM